MFTTLTPLAQEFRDPTAYPDVTKYDLEIFSSLGDKTKIYDELWTEIITLRGM